jgi:serine/threonine-protein kinase
VIDLAGRFDLGARVGGDALADVYRAFDHKLHRDVALRVLRADAAIDAEYLERFRREAEAAAEIRHPNIVEVLDQGVIGGRPFLVRELVAGSSLEDLLDRRRDLSTEEVRALAEQIALGLAAAHARGLLHRDVNAANIFVTPDGVAKIGDFGMLSAPHHPAPEQVAGKQIDERADVFGLGAVLRQMLGGHDRGGGSPSQARARSQLVRLRAVAARALEKDPARRYATAAVMAEALHELASPPPVTLPVTPPALPVTPPALRVTRAAASVPPTPRLVRPAVATARHRRASGPAYVLLALPVLLALLIAAFTLVRPAATRTAVLSATTTPQATLVITPSPAPTSLPPVETTPEPTVEPTAAPTAEPPADPTAEPTAGPTAEPAPPSPAAATVGRFYALVDEKRFDEAAALWSSRMQANYPPSTNIHGRFDRTRQIVVRGLAQAAESGGAATVTVDLLEVLDTGVTRHWVGQWQLVWDSARWLMDAPNLRPG